MIHNNLRKPSLLRAEISAPTLRSPHSIRFATHREFTVVAASPTCISSTAVPQQVSSSPRRGLRSANAWTAKRGMGSGVWVTSGTTRVAPAPTDVRTGSGSRRRRWRSGDRVSRVCCRCVATASRCSARGIPWSWERAERARFSSVARDASAESLPAERPVSARARSAPPRAAAGRAAACVE